MPLPVLPATWKMTSTPVLRDELLPNVLPPTGSLNALAKSLVGDAGGLDLDVGLDRLGAQLVALDVADARAADGDAADGADEPLLAHLGRDDAGQVPDLVFLVVELDVVAGARHPGRAGGPWSTPMNQTSGFTLATQPVAVPFAKPAVTMMW